MIERPERKVLLSRAWKLYCPQCGQAKMFRYWVLMLPRCGHCGLKYEREPGYFLGSIYVNYGLTALFTTFSYVALHYGLEVSNAWLMPPLIAWCLIFPVLFFPYARAHWLAMDLSFDRPEEDDEPPPGYNDAV